MPYQPVRFSRLRTLQSVVCALGVVAGLVLVGMALGGQGAAAGAAYAVAGGMLVFAAIVAWTLSALVLKIESTTARQLDQLRDILDALKAQSARVDAVVENTRISDAAKSLAHRDEELDALRKAIHDDVRNQKWDLAFGLVSEIERRFGYQEEAQRLRAELTEARERFIAEKLDVALSMIDKHFADHDWDLAGHEIERLAQLMPDHPKVRSLPERMRELREARKVQLRRAWDEAVSRSDTDHAIEVLKELDQFLTPEEANVLKDAARHVFKERLLQLGVQFRFAVTEKRWQDALNTGLELVREFPNARMADEVRQLLDVLRERARQSAQPAAVGSA